MFIQWLLTNKTLPCISYSTCPIVYVNKNLSCLTYGRVPTKGRNFVGTQKLRIGPVVLEKKMTMWKVYDNYNHENNKEDGKIVIRKDYLSQIFSNVLKIELFACLVWKILYLYFGLYKNPHMNIFASAYFAQ